MSDIWREVPLPAVLGFQEGPGILAKDFLESGIPLVRLRGLDTRSLSLAGCNFLDAEKVAKKWAHFRLRRGDIVTSTSASFGRVSVVDEIAEGAVFYTGLIRFWPLSDELDRSFIEYILRSPGFEAQGKAAATGSVIQHFGPTHLKQMSILLPPLSEQREIAATLRALDDKIELNRKTAATLEEMARALYCSWFVDFDPVRARAEGRAPAHMDPATAALFPDRFGEDGLPVGWRAGTLNDLAVLNPTAHSKKKHPQRIEYVDLAKTKWGRIEATTEYDWDAAPSRARMMLNVGDTIVGTVRPGNGSYSFIGRNGLTGSTGFAVLRPRREMDAALVYAASTDPETIDDLANLADGGAYPAVRSDVVAARPVCIGPEDIRRCYSDIATPFIDRIEAMKLECNTLAALRDTLLPRLMSGELRVGAARELLEEVA